MRRALATLQPVFLLTALLLSPVPADLACCAGVTAHGDSCCESADADPLARSCCTGDDSSATSQSELRLAPPAGVLTLAVVPAAPTPSSPQPLPFALPHPPDSGLYTLHSAFLI